MYAGRMYTFIHKKIFHASRLSALWFPSQISGLNCLVWPFVRGPPVRTLRSWDIEIASFSESTDGALETNKRTALEGHEQVATTYNASSQDVVERLAFWVHWTDLPCSNASRTCSPWLRLHSSSDIQHEPKASSSKYLVARSSLSPAPAVESRASDLPSAAQWRATWRGSYLEAKRERQTEAFHPESQLSASSHHDENGPQ